MIAIRYENGQYETYTLTLNEFITKHNPDTYIQKECLRKLFVEYEASYRVFWIGDIDLKRFLKQCFQEEFGSAHFNWLAIEHDVLYQHLWKSENELHLIGYTSFKDQTKTYIHCHTMPRKALFSVIHKMKSS